MKPMHNAAIGFKMKPNRAMSDMPEAKSDRKMIAVRLPEPLRTRVEEIARRDERSLNYVVVKLIEQAIRIGMLKEQ